MRIYPHRLLPKSSRIRRSQVFGAKIIFLVAALVSAGRRLQANPQGMTVVSGTASAQTSGSHLNVTTSQSAFLDWRGFNIQPGETTTFLQPSASSIVLNRINDSIPSQIWGSLFANGTVILANAHGFYFGPNSMIQVGGSFIATTAPLAPDMAASTSWQFTGLPPLASIVNYGAIEAGQGHSLFLIAEKLENHGELRAPGGEIGLHAGDETLLSERPDGRGLSATVKLPSGSVDNSGRIIAGAGRIALSAQVVNQNGLLQADSVRESGGVIELLASSELNLGPASQILARGGEGGASGGGAITLKSDGKFRDQSGGEILATGSSQGGDGGVIEISAPNILSLASRLDAGAVQGSHAGRLVLDPTDIVLDVSGIGSAGSGAVGATTGSGTLDLDVTTAFLNKNFSDITLQATHNISLADSTVWDLSADTGLTAGHLTLQAGNNIIFGNNARIVDANAWSLRLQAGVNFASGAVTPGVGSILLNGGAGKSSNGAVETALGSIEMVAGDSVLVGTGYIRTSGGGSVHVQALAGDIDAGKKNDGYQFTIGGYRISLSGLGGIATAAGGNVTLEAGQDIISIPTAPAGQPPGASGAYGQAPGDVTLIAGRQILGNYLVRNGTGTLLAGVEVQNAQVIKVLNSAADIGTSVQPVSLSLISGSWNLWAGGDIFIGEVRNPNGTFNSNRLTAPPGAFPGNLDNSQIIPPPNRTAFLFDYAPDAAANFWAGNSITLIGANLPRVTGQNQAMPAVYPPRLSLEAGAGGIDIRNSLILYPSSQGTLQITTHDGGDLQGQQQQAALTGITMSDSGLPDYHTFAQGHAVTPLHLADANPVRLRIDGSVESFGLAVPTSALIDISGNTYNFGFLGQNLSASAVTEINVAGDISNRGNLTSVPLSQPLPSPVLDLSMNADPQVILKVRYDVASQTLTFIGQMSQNELTSLLNPRRLLFDARGNPILDANGLQESEPIQLTAVQQAAFQQLYDQSQSASLGDQGFALAGPGLFKITARNADLGISGGISVLAPNPALAAISPIGANLEIAVSGNLDMTSTKIDNESYLGGVALSVGGTLDVGGQLTTFGDPGAPKGIFSASGGNVSVTADGDVNVNGSRIAAYNGGDLTILSRHGDVNAGSGGSGYVSLRGLEMDPVTGALRAIPATIPGSGILATTLPGSSAALGDINVTATDGSINANLGGIVQLAFNDADTRSSFIALHAGGDINAGGSGIIGSNIRLDAVGDIRGVVIGSQNVAINSQHNVNVSAFAGAGISISAVGNIGGTVVSGGNVSVSADAISASLISKSVSSSGDSSSAAIGLPQSNIAKTDVKVTEDASEITAKTSQEETDDELKKKRTQSPRLARTSGRVTVILPPTTK